MALPEIFHKGIRRGKHWRNLAGIQLRRVREGLTDPRSRLLPGTSDYELHSRKEREHYSEMYAGDPSLLFEPEPPTWMEVERRTESLVREATGNDITGHVLSRLTGRPGVRMLSLGSGPGGVELMLAGEAPECRITCIDFNENLLALGRTRAREQGLALEFQKADLNNVSLPEGEFDLIFCHASLHHVVNLEDLAAEIRKTLRPGGALIVVDVIARTGYRMWPETRRVVETLWATLPARYRVNHTAYGERRLDRRIWDGGTDHEGMECIRSGDLVGILESNFERVFFASCHGLSRRFFNTMYGWNYDLAQPLDRAILDWIWELDCRMVSSGKLRGESMFGVYAPRQNQ
ncbi:MAG: class I SAM-dependent methyltransferase [Acidobacteriia bacterium]|nr:class I SAM-dependent methyltransferase [Terriglobia bacterium]